MKAKLDGHVLQDGTSRGRGSLKGVLRLFQIHPHRCAGGSRTCREGADESQHRHLYRGAS
ncbi:unnamed protein product [Clonostachys rosea f. rosea IK726]|uniref:Uncharacterized protein n=1 Tax=Clonostachys rosea f. rosea IK726 TaxID=1349383 RepID=A0ACA9TZX6_BIOOC|nr:unnamed protein product [Clonostachys rosea f. rosea IK726]